MLYRTLPPGARSIPCRRIDGPRDLRSTTSPTDPHGHGGNARFDEEAHRWSTVGIVSALTAGTVTGRRSSGSLFIRRSDASAATCGMDRTRRSSGCGRLGVARRMLSAHKRREKQKAAQEGLWLDPVPQHIWQAHFYDYNVWSGRKQVEKVRYIHRNPVRRGFLESRPYSGQGLWR